MRPCRAHRSNRGSGWLPPAPPADRTGDEARQIAGRSLGLQESCLYQRTVHVGPAVAEKLPRLSHFADQSQIQSSCQYFVFVTRALCDYLAARVAEVTRSVKLPDVPGRFNAHTINRRDEVTVGCGVRRLLQLPQMFAESGDGRRGVVNDLRPVQPQRPRTFRKMPVVTNVDSNLREPEIEYWITEIAGPEIKLLPESGSHVRNVCLPVLP